MDVKCYHADCCACAEATKGHYGVARTVADGMRVADATVQVEKRGFVDASEERPADVFTIAAVQGRDAALDITISSPHRVDAGEDCTLSAYMRKTTRYREVIEALRRAGIAFRPMVWSSEGRPHPVVKRVRPLRRRLL